MDLMGMMGKLKETQQKIEDTKKRLDTVLIDEQSTDGLLKVTLTANSTTGTYLWSPGGATTRAITVSTAGNYSVVVTGTGNYIYKFAVAILLTPVIYGVHAWIERYLGKSLAGEMKQAAMGAA